MDTRSIQLPSETNDAFSVQVFSVDCRCNINSIPIGQTTTLTFTSTSWKEVIGLGKSAYTKAAVAKVFTSFVRAQISNLKDSRGEIASEGAEAMVGNHLEVGRVALRG